ncbi:hypothetical protein [Sabulibacter ruber]|uniref:hypothetical protein n=1 Tax=Sabulibacter ruber TaxID=2811901 RepID=UPI001A95AC25|nr:hypothetical protein [Sabulibacter ruber]
MLKQSYLLSLLAAFVLVFTSCSKDDKDDPTPRIDGKQLQNHEWVVTEHIVKATDEEDYDVLAEYDGNEVTFEFKENGEYTIYVDGEHFSEGSYEVKGDKLNWDCQLSVIGQTMEDETSFTISELSNSKLKLTYSVKVQNVTVTENIAMNAK